MPRSAEEICKDLDAIYKETEEKTAILISELQELQAAESPLDVLQAEVEKLLGLLKDRQIGLVSWHTFFQQRVNAIGAWIEAAKKS